MVQYWGADAWKLAFSRIKSLHLESTVVPRERPKRPDGVHHVPHEVRRETEPEQPVGAPRAADPVGGIRSRVCGQVSREGGQSRQAVPHGAGGVAHQGDEESRR